MRFPRQASRISAAIPPSQTSTSSAVSPLPFDRLSWNPVTAKFVTTLFREKVAPTDAVVATDTASANADRDNGIALQRLSGRRGYDGHTAHRLDAGQAVRATSARKRHSSSTSRASLPSIRFHNLLRVARHPATHRETGIAAYCPDSTPPGGLSADQYSHLPARLPDAARHRDNRCFALSTA